MSELEVKINEPEFERLGVRPHFDSETYKGLLTENYQIPPPEDILLTPHNVWNTETDGFMKSVMNRIRDGRHLHIGGSYNIHDKTIVIYCHKDVEKTNNLLLHETKHHIDNIFPLSSIGLGNMLNPSSITIDNYRENYFKNMSSRGNYILAGTAFTLGAAVIEPLVALAAYVPASLAYQKISKHIRKKIYLNLDSEVAAREFSEDEERLKKFGRIISYGPA